MSDIHHYLSRKVDEYFLDFQDLDGVSYCIKVFQSQDEYFCLVERYCHLIVQVNLANDDGHSNENEFVTVEEEIASRDNSEIWESRRYASVQKALDEALSILEARHLAKQ